MARPSLAVLTVALFGALSPVAAQDKVPPGDTKPVSEADRLKALERKVDDQQREIDSLKLDLRPRPPTAPTKDAGGDNSSEDSGPELGFNEGFFVKGHFHGADYLFRPVAGFQLDYRLYPHAKPSDQFLVRRADVGFMGNFGDFGFVFRVAPTRPGGQIPLVDFWLQWQKFEEFRVRVGHFYAPFTIDNGYQQDFRSDFIERPMAMGSGTVISPDYRPGAEVLGALGEGIFKYWLAVTNTLDTNTPASGDPMVTGRIELDHWGFVVGGEGSWDRRPNGSTSFPGLTPGQFQFFTPIAIRGWEQRYGVNLDYYNGPFWFRISFLWAVQQREKVLADGSDGTGFITQGSYVTVGWKFWGPLPTATRPDAPFKDWVLFSTDLEKKHNKRDVGMDAAVRLDWIDLRDAHGGRKGQGGVPAVPSTLPNADDVAGNQAVALCFGLNFSPIENVRIMADYVHLRIGDQARAEKQHSRSSDEILFRTQFDF